MRKSIGPAFHYRRFAAHNEQKSARAARERQLARTNDTTPDTGRGTPKTASRADNFSPVQAPQITEAARGVDEDHDEDACPELVEAPSES